LNRNIIPVSILKIEKLLVEAFRLIVHKRQWLDRLIKLLRPPLDKLIKTIAGMPMATAKLS